MIGHLKQNVFFYTIAIAMAIISCILVFFSNTYTIITDEDHILEYFGFFFLIIAGILLIGSGLKDNFPNIKIIRWAFFFAGLVFIITALEEISWGQRIFEFKTPEGVVVINQQEEFNFHNINKKFFDRLVDRVNILFVFIATFWLILKKDRLYGIRIPSIPLILAFSIIPFYHQYNQLTLDFYHLLYIPIVIITIKGFIENNTEIIIISIVALLITLGIAALHTTFNHHFPEHNNSANEVRETLFSLACVFYAYQIYKDVKKEHKLRSDLI
jgi:hypothetical protein